MCQHYLQSDTVHLPGNSVLYLMLQALRIEVAYMKEFVLMRCRNHEKVSSLCRMHVFANDSIPIL
jgi:hypothetical protein